MRAERQVTGRMTVLVFQHDPLEDLGFFADVLDRQEINVRMFRLFEGEMPVEEWKNVDAMIILGGSMGVDEEGRFPFLRWEKKIIRAAIEEAVPMLGVCLGAQLIAATFRSRSFRAR